MKCDLEFASEIQDRAPQFLDFSTVGRECYNSRERKDIALAPFEAFAFRYIKKKRMTKVVELFAETARLAYRVNLEGKTCYTDDPLESHKSLHNDLGIKNVLLIPDHEKSEDIELVVILESLVRLPNPLEYLIDLRNQYPDARVLITVPSKKRSVLNPLNPMNADRPPHQLTYWSMKSLKLLLNSAGYEIEKVCPIMLDFEFTKMSRPVKFALKLLFIAINEGEYSLAAIGRAT